MRSNIEKREKLSPGAQTALRLLATALILLALKCHIEVIDGLETGSALLSFMSKLSNSFSSGGLQDIFLFCGIYWLFKYTADSRPRFPLSFSILAAVFSLLYLIAQNYRFSDTLEFFNANLYQRFLSLGCMLGFFLLFLLLIKAAYKRLNTPAAAWTPPPRLQLWCFLAILLCWLPWTLMNYPASFCPDSAAQLEQFFSQHSWSNHQPVFSTFIMGSCVWLGDLFGSKNFGAFLYLLLQSVFGAFVFSLCAKKMAELGAGRGLCYAAVAFFALTPLWGCFAQWFEKDLLYAEMTTLLIVIFAGVIKSREISPKAAVGLCLGVVAAALLRNGGIYEFVPALLLLLLYFKKADRRRLLFSLCGVLILYFGITKLAYPSMGIRAGSVREMLSIPFQQTALYVERYDEELTDEERETIDAVLVYDAIENYDPRISDPVKNSYREDGSKLPAYFNLWFKQFFKHPGTYFEAFLLKSSGYLAPAGASLDAYIQTVYPPEVSELGISRCFGDMPTRLFDCVRQFSISAPIVDLLCAVGSYTWLLIACFVMLLRRKKFEALLLFVPGIMNILICFASPLFNSIRYELPVVASVPLLIAWTKTWLIDKEA